MEGKGLTNTEIAGSGAPGSSAAQGSQATLGNSAAKIAEQMAQRRYDAQQRDLDRQTTIRGQDAQLLQTKMQTDAQVQSAGISAGATTFAAQVMAEVQNRRLEFDKRTYDEITAPKAAAELNVTNAVFQRTINEVATSDPEFVMKKLQLSMGKENMQASALMDMMGVTFSDPDSFKKLSMDERKNFLSLMIMLDSHLASEFFGATSAMDTALRRSVGQTPGEFQMLGRGKPSAQ
jgi:hypothetical protein